MIQRQRRRFDPTLLGEGGDGLVLGLLVVGLFAHQVHVAPVAGLASREAPLRLVVLGQEAGAEVGIAQRGQLAS